MQITKEQLIDIMPHLEEILGYYYDDEKRDFDALTDGGHDAPDQHIFFSLDALEDFISSVKR